MAPGGPLGQAALTWGGRTDPAERKLRNERGLHADVSLWLLAATLLVPLPILRIAFVEQRVGLALSLAPHVPFLAWMAWLASRRRAFYVQHREVLCVTNMVLVNIMVRFAGQGGTNYFYQHKGSPARLAGLLLMTGHAVWSLFFPLYHRLPLGWSAAAASLSAFVPLAFGRSLCHRLVVVPGVHAPLADLYSVLSVAHNIVAAPGSMALAASPGSPLQQCLALDAYFLVGLGCVLPLALLAALQAHERSLAHRSRQAAAAAAAAASGAAPEPQQAAPPQFALDIEASPLVHHCQRVRRVCVDQGQLIFYEQRHQPGGGREPDPLPEIIIHPTRLYFFPWTAGTKSDSSDRIDGDSPGDGSGTSSGDEDWGDEKDGAEIAGAGRTGGGAGAVQRQLLHQQPRRAAYETHAPGEHFRRRRLLPMPTRPASALEPTPYLAQPAFSTCTVPVVLYPIFAENFAHLFHDAASFLHSLLRRTPWRAHARVVAFTPDGLAMTQPEAQLLPVLSNMSVVSWADFSRRLPPDYNPQADRQLSPASWEGDEQRCFDSLFICGRRFKPDRPLELGMPGSEEEEQARLRTAVPRENYGFGQEVVRWYQRQGLVPLPPKPAAAAVASIGGSSRQLKVLFMRRDSGGRQLLNAEALVRSCNAWRYQLPAGGEVSADCRQVELPNLEAGIAAAQEADVFIGMHGANMANSYLMRPGSSTIEITPYEFGKMKGVFGPCTQNAQDASSRLLWWSAVVCDASLSTPGPEEAAGREPSRWWPRDRSSRVPWAVLQTILEEIVQVAGDRQRYLAGYFVPSRHRFHFTAQGVVSRGDQPLCSGA
ncbi:hypothetical protein ABPG77_000833 [Micractinium sp. CCAP 211/92]